MFISTSVNTVHWEGFGRIPPQIGPQADGMSTSEREVLKVVLSTTGGSNGGGRITGGR